MAENFKNFTYHPSVEDFAVSRLSYLTVHPNSPFSHVGTSTLVLSITNPSKPRILLLQRAASDTHPHEWEPPGGAVDDEDPSILHGAARELWEEAGLQAVRIVGLVGEPRLFTSSGGKKVCLFYFAVDVIGGSEVKLDAKEHQRFVWATEDEVKAKRADGMDLHFTSEEAEQMVLLAYDYFRGNQVQDQHGK